MLLTRCYFDPLLIHPKTKDTNIQILRMADIIRTKYIHQIYMEGSVRKWPLSLYSLNVATLPSSAAK